MTDVLHWRRYTRARQVMTWLEDPPPWLCPAYFFGSVTDNKIVTISDRFICFILTVK